MSQPIHRIQYTHDKLGRKTGVIFYYKILQGHRKMMEELLSDGFDLTDEDKKMLRTCLRVGDYSEHDRDKLLELRRMYIEDNKL